MGVIWRGGFAFPDHDEWGFPDTLAGLADLDRAVALTSGRRVALQAGGASGVFAARLARVFGQVVTLEPEPRNFACLRVNVPRNVIAHRAALGARTGRCGLRVHGRNAGAHWIVPQGEVPMATVDGLGLRGLDLVVLDVEGFELFALHGAVETLTRFRPVVMLEERGHGGRYGLKPGAAEGWLRDVLRYSVAVRLAHDVILTPA